MNKQKVKYEKQWWDSSLDNKKNVLLDQIISYSLGGLKNQKAICMTFLFTAGGSYHTDLHVHWR